MKLNHPLVLFVSVLSFVFIQSAQAKRFVFNPNQETKWIGDKTAALKINEYVKQQFAIKAEVPVFIILKQQADLSQVAKIADRNQRITAIYQKLVAHANQTQGGVMSLITKASVPYQRYFISNSILIVKANRALVEQIALLPEVKKVIGNPSVAMSQPVPSAAPVNSSGSSMTSGFESIFNLRSSTITGVGENITSLKVDKVWEELGAEGKGIVVAGQDTGVQWDHPALINQYRGWNGTQANHDYNWHDSVHFYYNPEGSASRCGYNSAVPCDDGDHGSHTMGTIVGSDGAENKIGVAPKAKWISCRNMDGGFGNPSSYLECFQFFLAPTPVTGDPFLTGRPDLAPHVINNSWGCPKVEGCDGDEMIPALQVMKAAGIMVVVSAGNDGPNCSTIQDAPAHNVDLVFTVGAYNHRTGSIADFSSRGPSKLNGLAGPDVAAPGVSIRSSVPGSRYDQAMWSGTSMAGPHVAGEVALLWSANPALIGKIDETANLIRKTATPKTTTQACGTNVSGSFPNNVYGYGNIQPYEAVKAALGIN